MNLSLGESRFAMRDIKLSIFFSFLVITGSLAQDEKYKDAASDIITNSNNCILITLDKTKSSQARIMDAFLPDENFVIWMATNPNSRKVSQIKRNPKVVVFYTDKDEQGYVSIHGRAELVNDNQPKEKYWKKEWEQFYPDRDKGLILIKVIPDYLEVINYRRGVSGDSITWQPVKVVFRH